MRDSSLRVGAELERHHNARDDTQTERDAENLEPELEDDTVGRPSRPGLSASKTVSHAASPIVNDGKMMWNDTVKANCSATA